MDSITCGVVLRPSVLLLTLLLLLSFVDLFSVGDNECSVKTVRLLLRVCVTFAAIILLQLFTGILLLLLLLTSVEMPTCWLFYGEVSESSSNKLLLLLLLPLLICPLVLDTFIFRTAVFLSLKGTVLLAETDDDDALVVEAVRSKGEIDYTLEDDDEACRCSLMCWPDPITTTPPLSLSATTMGELEWDVDPTKPVLLLLLCDGRWGGVSRSLLSAWADTTLLSLSILF